MLEKGETMNQVVTEAKDDQPIEGGSAAKTQQTHYFAASTLKLVLMSVCTFGIYELYWFYKNWVVIKQHTDQNLMPFWRAFFAPFWAYSCFKHIKLVAEERGISVSLSIGLLAFGYFVLQALWRLPDPYWFISFLSFAPIIPINTVVLAINQNIGGENYENSNFTTWNWVGLVTGGLLFVLSAIGMLLSKS
jgi:hypothetical protein